MKALPWERFEDCPPHLLPSTLSSLTKSVYQKCSQGPLEKKQDLKALTPINNRSSIQPKGTFKSNQSCGQQQVGKEKRFGGNKAVCEPTSLIETQRLGQSKSPGVSKSQKPISEPSLQRNSNWIKSDYTAIYNPRTLLKSLQQTTGYNQEKDINKNPAPTMPSHNDCGIQDSYSLSNIIRGQQ